RVVAQEPDGLHARAQRAEVLDRVGPAARLQLRGLIADDQHRRFPADTVGLAIDELVGNQIAYGGNPDFREPGKELCQVGIHRPRDYHARRSGDTIRNPCQVSCPGWHELRIVSPDLWTGLPAAVHPEPVVRTGAHHLLDRLGDLLRQVLDRGVARLG